MIALCPEAPRTQPYSWSRTGETTMNVSGALATRKACRAFKNTPVSEALGDIPTPPFGPLRRQSQPWRVYAVTGAVQQAIVDEVQEDENHAPRRRRGYHVIL